MQYSYGEKAKASGPAASNCNGVGRRGLCSGDMSVELIVCQTSEVNQHLLTSHHSCCTDSILVSAENHIRV
jgi:hypothetical protein